MKTGLAFSGGKDSLACLFLNKDRLDDISVFWINTGKTYPETLNVIDYAKSICPNFEEVKIDRDLQNAREGIPSDVVPVAWTKIGQSMTSKKETMIQPYISCCFENIGLQIHKYALANGITHLIKGQRNDESHKSTSRNGDVVIGGIKMLHPIENWTKQEVMDFIAIYMDVPKHFMFNHSSLDCYDCTAYVKESSDRIEFTKNNYPDFYAEYFERKNKLDTVIKEALG
jgi:3'-phosphoadenosine 5'-phosphosulfate sulfotransferase (PAPS reductase)/FAD synthetase